MTDGSPLEGTYEELGVVAWLLVDEDVRTVLLLGLYVPPYLADWYRAASVLIGGE